MMAKARTLFHLVSKAALFAGMLALSAGAAQAQGTACARFESLLAGIEAAPQFRNLARLEYEMQRAEGRLATEEGRFAGAQCATRMNAFGAAGWQCQNLARSIAEGRANLGAMSAQARDGRSLAQQHRTLLAEASRAGCAASAGSGSGVTISRGGSDSFSQRSAMLTELFAAPAPGQAGYGRQEAAPAPVRSLQTRRSVCVRTCDGYFWPVSFSTTGPHLNEDATACAQQCPGTPVQLFSYRNPGETPEDMVSLSGEAYRAMPYAFRYRERYEPGCSCQGRQAGGNFMELPEAPSQSQALLPLTAAEPPVSPPLPLPRRDPRQAAAEPALAPGDPEDARIVRFGDRRVRIVGPETPYVPAAEEPS